MPLVGRLDKDPIELGRKENRIPISTTQDRRSIVGSLAKGLRVLESFHDGSLEKTLTEVSNLTDLDPGTTFRILNTLTALGYMARVPNSRRYRLTLKVADLGLNAIGHTDLREFARPVLRSLVGEINEAASLGVLDGGDILYIERVRAGVTRLGVDIRIGTTMPVGCTAIGEAILAFLPKVQKDRALKTAPRASHLPTLSRTKKEIDRNLEDVRRHGYAMRDSYLQNGIRILACPVLDADGYPVAAISVSAPAVRLSANEFRQRALAPLQTAATEIARVFQATGTFVANS